MKKCVYNGVEYKSHADLCRALNLSESTFCSRLYNGWSIERAVEKPITKYNGNPSEDYLGNKFPSQNQMAEYWGITPRKLRYRLSKGYSLKTALTKQKIRDGFKNAD